MSGNASYGLCILLNDPIFTDYVAMLFCTHRERGLAVCMNEDLHAICVNAQPPRALDAREIVGQTPTPTDLP